MRPFEEPLAVTGLGAVCNLGDDLEAITDHLLAGRPGRFVVEPIAEEHAARCTVIGRVHTPLDDEALGLDRKSSRFMGRASRLALRASRHALASSGVDPTRLSVVFGSGAGDVDTHRDVQDRLDRTGSMRRIPPTVIPRIMSSTVSANLVNALGATGPSLTAAAACAGGAWNLATAALLLDSGHAEAVLAGGVECWDPHFHAGFDSMRAYNGTDNDAPERASRPYAADRAGFVMGEGAGAVVLERLSRARARGATVHGLLVGFGASSDGSGDMVAPDPEGPRRAMLQALAHAGLEPGQVGYVNTHATSTPAGDLSEVRAMREVFDPLPPYASTKGYTGHTISAAGALEAVFTWQMLRRARLAPSVNADPVDPELDGARPLLEACDATPEYALSNSFGFGGTNVSLVLSRG